MNVLEKNRKRNRFPHYDYSQPGYYSLTICTKRMETHFGVIEDGIMTLSNIGGIVDRCWQAIPEHFREIDLDEYKIMPNHIHGIAIISSVGDSELRVIRDAELRVVGDADLRPVQSTDRSKMLLSKVIHGFKSSVSREINSKYPRNNFSWQRSYYDHVIRNEKSLLETRKYVVENPLKWEFDKNNPINLKDNSPLSSGQA